MGLRAFVFGPKGTMSEDGLKTVYAALRDALQSAQSQRAQAEAALAELRAAAKAAGLAAALQALEHPPAPPPVAREAFSTRVRALQSFVTEYQGLPVDGAPGDIFDAPDSLVVKLEKGGIVERVDPTTQLHRVAIHW